MHSLALLARLLLGMPYLVLGLDGFLGFLPLPEPPPRARAFVDALAETGYLLELVKGTEIACGLALVSGRLVPLALVVLAPVTLNVVLFHLFLAPELSGRVLAFTLLGLHLLVAACYGRSFVFVLRPWARPFEGPRV